MAHRQTGILFIKNSGFFLGGGKGVLDRWGRAAVTG
jgi:hypothetical protein